MRNRLYLCICVMALAMVSVIFCADYSGAFGLPGLPSFPLVTGGSLTCGEPIGCAGIGAPTFYLGWGIPDNNGSSSSLDAHGRGASHLLASTTRTRDANNGLWLGAALPVCLGNNLSILGTGWYLFPGNGTANLRRTLSTARGIVEGDWSSKVDHWFVDGSLAYGGCGFSVLVGVRYDYYSTERYSPDPDISYNGQERADATFKSVIPFVGFQSTYADMSQRLNFRLLGTPVLWGTTTIGSTTNGARSVYDNVSYSGGYFYEIFGEYSRKFSASSQAGVFARWNMIHATASGPYTNYATNGSRTSDDYDWTRNGYTWTIGGLITLDFNLSL